MPNVVFTPLPDSSDERGVSFSILGELLDSMPKVRDVHISSLRPGAIRGNHYHSVKTEVITVAYVDAWSFYWDMGEGTEVQSRQFVGTGAVAVAVPLNWSHAVRNEGASDLWLFNASDMAFGREPGAASDSHVRKVVQ
jgi:oxalate decarboxylase/phosphoglucose isomerase-like protein (cupin superfamily)